MFISKKQKKAIRERRRKKNLSGVKRKNHAEKSVTSVDEGTGLLELLEQAQSGHENGFTHGLNGLNGIENVTGTESNDQKVSNGKNTVVIPSNLTAKEAKKFRKDRRRQARKEGINEDMVRFVEEGKEHIKEEKEKQNSTKKSDSPPPNKKRKREFPKINQLLQEEKKKEEIRAKKEAQEKSESLLTDEMKEQYRAVDCEMVGIGTNGKISALARVSMTNWDGDVLLDTFVKVPSKVTDFRTQWSGVSAKHIKSDSAMGVDECRSRVAALLKGKILVGHALKNDLDALLLTHPKNEIRDTARYRPYQRLAGKKWRPRKLRDLVKQHCGMEIQKDGESHDSIDDARAAMELFKVAREAWETELAKKLKKK